MTRVQPPELPTGGPWATNHRSLRTRSELWTWVCPTYPLGDLQPILLIPPRKLSRLNVRLTQRVFHSTLPASLEDLAPIRSSGPPYTSSYSRASEAPVNPCKSRFLPLILRSSLLSVNPFSNSRRISIGGIPLYLGRGRQPTGTTGGETHDFMCRICVQRW